jgi:outer membrane usher protein
VFASQQEIGRTNRDGHLLIPDLISYSRNELTIADGDVPLSSAIESTERLVVPAYRGGAVVDFPVRSVRAIVGTIEVMTESGLTIPAFGELTVRSAGSSSSSPIGRQGEFYLENLPAGAHPATVEWNGHQCGFTLTVGSSSARQIDLGMVRCGLPGGGQ